MIRADGYVSESQLNCWLYYSLIYEHVVPQGAGNYKLGKLPFPDLAPEARRRIYLRHAAEHPERYAGRMTVSGI